MDKASRFFDRMSSPAGASAPHSCTHFPYLTEGSPVKKVGWTHRAAKFYLLDKRGRRDPHQPLRFLGNRNRGSISGVKETFLNVQLPNSVPLEKLCGYLAEYRKEG